MAWALKTDHFLQLKAEEVQQKGKSEIIQNQPRGLWWRGQVQKLERGP